MEENEPSMVMRMVAATFTENFDSLFIRMSNEYDRIVVAGSHPRMIKGKLCNVSSIYVPRHPPVHQPKIHLTGTEREKWQFNPGNSLEIIDTGFLRFASAISYDAEFPEISRLLAQNGVQLLLIPYLADDRRGHVRVTNCARTRAIENQFFVATAGMAGSLPLTTFLTAQYAQSGIYTPSDYPFPLDGLAAEASPNAEMVIVSDLDLALLDQARAHGTVHNFKDSANDVLSIKFKGHINVHQRHWMV
jgi:predicted amidohydrolase